MKIKDLANLPQLHVCVMASGEKELKNVYCCDLLSRAMVRLPDDACWATVVCNRNTLAAAVGGGCWCILVADGVHVAQSVIDKANEEQIALFTTQLDAFQAAHLVFERLEKEKKKAL